VGDGGIFISTFHGGFYLPQSPKRKCGVFFMLGVSVYPVRCDNYLTGIVSFRHRRKGRIPVFSALRVLILRVKWGDEVLDNVVGKLAKNKYDYVGY